jgi:hypothetical protein
MDKGKAAGFDALKTGDTVGIRQANLILVCAKIAFQDLNPAGFLDGAIDGNYPTQDYHRMFVGEITSVLARNG